MARVGIRHQFGMICKNDKGRWRYRLLCCIQDIYRTSTSTGSAIRDPPQMPVQTCCWHSTSPAVENCSCSFQTSRDPAPCQGRKNYKWKIPEERVLSSNAVGELPGILGEFDGIPFVDGNDHSASRLQDLGHGPGVLRRDSLDRVDHRQGDIRLLNRTCRAQRTVVLHRVIDPTPPAHPGRVHQQEPASLPLDADFGGVAGGTGPVVDDGDPRPGESVHQGGLPDVRPAGKHHPNRMLIIPGIGRSSPGFEPGGKRIKKVSRQSPGCRRHGNRCPQPQAEKIPQQRIFLPWVIEFVHDHQRLRTASSQHLGDFAVSGRGTGSGVAHEHDDIRLLHGALCLHSYRRFDCISGKGNESASIHQGKTAAIPLCLNGDAIPCNSGVIVGNCLPPTCKPVKQRRLADIWTADDSHKRPQQSSR